ncbi:RING finger protein 112 [Chelonia mydas]|uniref:RING finger protein 112 n=1 Tax=Chelonia mydas TaxID=8469 RepID=UPI001CA842BE|nr:RING finger protein 112 [Chelonia mydas]
MTSCNPSSRSGSTQGTEIQTGQQGPGAQPEPGRPVQLVCLDEKGDLTLDKEALRRCLEQGGVGDAPVCLVSIIGEQRRGKSFLLNCLLRQLQSPEAVDASWMDREDEVLGGFECCNGIETVTKGVWMWDQPLWVQDQGRRVAVFLVDTEGCLDLQRPMETSIKLSVFSILLSSYWIFNISSTFTRMEADYLEMFIQVAKEVGETCNLAPIQHLDLLVRDWQLSGAYGADGGQEYLRDTTQKLEASAQQPLVVEALRESGTRCYLLPHPGTEFIRSGAGMPGNTWVPPGCLCPFPPPADMDKYFRHYLRDYLSTVECSAGTHARTDQARQGLTGAQLAARIKDVSQYLKTKRYNFSSPVKMSELFAAMREEINSRAVEAASQEYEQFVQQLDRDHQSTSSCLNVEPAEMQQRLEVKRQELLERCRGELRGKDPEKQAALEELKQGLDRLMAQFLPGYEQRFKMAEMAEMREKANRKAVEDTRREYEQFREKQDRDHQTMSSCLSVKPLEMQQRLEEKRQELLERCRGELQGEDPQKQAALEELKQELDRLMAQFLSDYKLRFKMAEMSAIIQEVNRRAVEATRREFQQFVNQRDRDHGSMRRCLRVKPLEMRHRLERKRQELLERCRAELLGEDPQKQAALEELEQGLDEQTTPFLSTYRERFERAVMEANSRAVEAARTEYEQFVQEQHRDHRSMISCLNVEPAEIQDCLEEKRQELLERCRGELWGEDPQKQAALEELEQGLDKQTTQFLSTYGQRFKRAEMEANSRAVEAARTEYEQFVQEQDREHRSMSSCLSVEPEEMQRCLEEKREELQECCRGELRGEDPQKQAALKGLEHDLDKQITQFLSTYGERFKKNTILKGVCIVGGSLAVVGAAAGAGIGVGVAAVVAAVGEGAAIAVGAGGGGLIGGGAGAWLGQKFGRNKTGRNTAGQGSSDREPLTSRRGT